jgi:signal peptidase I
MELFRNGELGVESLLLSETAMAFEPECFSLKSENQVLSFPAAREKEGCLDRAGRTHDFPGFEAVKFPPSRIVTKGFLECDLNACGEIFSGLFLSQVSIGSSIIGEIYPIYKYVSSKIPGVIQRNRMYQGSRVMKHSDKAQTEQKAARETSVLPIIFIIVLVLIAIRTFVIDVALVDGRSMQPSLRSGDPVLILKLAYGLRNPAGAYCIVWARPKNRDIVAARRPDSDVVVIKRVSGKLGNAQEATNVFLLGDNLYESVDSREFGLVPMNNILGKVIGIPRF